MKKFGFGLMRLPRLDAADAGSIDLELFKKMVDAFMEKGFTYFDTAWMYCNFKSEEFTKEALVKRYPREAFTLTDKLPPFFMKTAEDRDRILNVQLERTGAGYFDYYLLHDINSASLEIFEKLDCFNWIQEKKEQGIVKHIGFSCHDNAAFVDKVLTAHPEMEFVQLQVNYLDWESNAIESRKCCEVAAAHGKPVIVMEPVKGGTLAQLPERAQKIYDENKKFDESAAAFAIRFTASVDNVMMVLSGMNSMEQLNENMKIMDDFVPLDDEEMALAAKLADAINSELAIPCTGCAYCVSDCPQKIDIPQFFSLYNADMQEAAEKVALWSPQEDYYNNIKVTGASPADCLECGRCEELCPQHLEIRELLKTVRARFEH